MVESDLANPADINLRIDTEPTVNVELVGPSSNLAPSIQQREDVGDLTLVELEGNRADIVAKAHIDAEPNELYHTNEALVALDDYMGPMAATEMGRTVVPEGATSEGPNADCSQLPETRVVPHDAAPNSADQPLIVDPNHVRQLMEIGFNRSDAHQALVNNRCDVDAAIDELLSGNARN